MPSDQRDILEKCICVHVKKICEKHLYRWQKQDIQQLEGEKKWVINIQKVLFFLRIGVGRRLMR